MMNAALQKIDINEDEDLWYLTMADRLENSPTKADLVEVAKFLRDKSWSNGENVRFGMRGIIRCKIEKDYMSEFDDGIFLYTHEMGLELHVSPSMRSMVTPAFVQEEYRAVKEFLESQHETLILPKECPYTVEQILGEL